MTNTSDGEGTSVSRSQNGPGGCREGRRLLEQLRLVARHLETAEVLERCADLSGNHVVTALLGERATRHRQAADRLRCGLPPVIGADGGVRTAVG
jgi:hypothetical protein